MEWIGAAKANKKSGFLSAAAAAAAALHAKSRFEGGRERSAATKRLPSLPPSLPPSVSH